MERVTRRMWLRAVLRSLVVFLLLVVFSLTALDRTLPSALVFPALLSLATLVAAGLYIRASSGPGGS